MEEVNETSIIFIPKIPNPTSMVNFRPISLCMVLYKIIATVLANRLSKRLDNCIDKPHSAFVLKRLISDNVLVGYELLHTFK